MKLRKRHHLVYWTFVWTLTEISALPDVPSQGKEADRNRDLAQKIRDARLLRIFLQIETSVLSVFLNLVHGKCSCTDCRALQG